MQPNLCPHCAAEIAAGADYCSQCTRLVRDFVKCQACREPISKEAKRCPHCREGVVTAVERKKDQFAAEVTATRLGAFLLEGNITALFKPPKLIVRNTKILAVKWTLFALRRHQSEIGFDRVASVRYTKGVFWGGVLIETFGGVAEDLGRKGLRIEEAIGLAESLNEIVGQPARTGSMCASADRESPARQEA